METTSLILCPSILPVTDINDAVLRAVDMLVKDKQNNLLPDRSVSMIILLTDGMPNRGELRSPRKLYKINLIVFFMCVCVCVYEICFAHMYG